MGDKIRIEKVTVKRVRGNHMFVDENGEGGHSHSSEESQSGNDDEDDGGSSS